MRAASVLYVVWVVFRGLEFGFVAATYELPTRDWVPRVLAMTGAGIAGAVVVFSLAGRLGRGEPGAGDRPFDRSALFRLVRILIAAWCLVRACRYAVDAPFTTDSYGLFNMVIGVRPAEVWTYAAVHALLGLALALDTPRLARAVWRAIGPMKKTAGDPSGG